MSDNKGNQKLVLWTMIAACAALVAIVCILIINGVTPSKFDAKVGSDGLNLNWTSAEKEDVLTELNLAFKDEEVRTVAWVIIEDKYSDDVRKQDWISGKLERDFKGKDTIASDQLLVSYKLASNLRALSEKRRAPFHIQGIDVRVTVPESKFPAGDAHVHSDSPFVGHEVTLKNLQNGKEVTLHAKAEPAITDRELVQVMKQAATDLFSTANNSENEANIRMAS